MRRNRKNRKFDKNGDNSMSNIPPVGKYQHQSVKDREMQNITPAPKGTSSVASSQQKCIVEYRPVVGQCASCSSTNSRQYYTRDQLKILRSSVLSWIKPALNPSAEPLLRSTATTVIDQPNRNAFLPSFVSARQQQQPHVLSSSIGAFQVRKSASYEGPTSRTLEKSSGKHADDDTTIRVNISLYESVKLKESTNAWRPLHLRLGTEEDRPQQPDVANKDQLKRKVRGILNKLSPEKFDILVEQLSGLQIDTAEKIIAVMELIFEKAIDEPNFSETYAKLCCKLIECKLQTVDQQEASAKNTNLNIFRKALIAKTEEKFRENILSTEAKDNLLHEIKDQIEKCTEPAQECELKATLEEQEMKIKRRFVGTVKFIGELFKISILNQNIVFQCIESLLVDNDEEKLEYLCQLLRTISKTVESGSSLERAIGFMKKVVNRKEVSSRIRFMLQDILELYKEKSRTKTSETFKVPEQKPKTETVESLETRTSDLNLESTTKDDGKDTSDPHADINEAFNQFSIPSRRKHRNYSYHPCNKKRFENRQLPSRMKVDCMVDTKKLDRLLNTGKENVTKLGARQQFQWNPGESASGLNKGSFYLLSNPSSGTETSTESLNKESTYIDEEDFSKE